MPAPNEFFNPLIAGKKPTIASSDVEEKFSAKMKNISDAELEEETRQKAAALGLPYINLKSFPINSEILILIPEEEAKSVKAICFYMRTGDIRVACLDPFNEALPPVVARLEKENHAQVGLYLISENSFDFAYQLYKNLPHLRRAVSGIEITEEDIKRYEREIITFRDLDRKLKEVSITDLLTLIVAAATKARSSDIHIEAEENGIKVRFRIDGILAGCRRNAAKTLAPGNFADKNHFQAEDQYFRPAAGRAVHHFFNQR